MFYIDKDNLLEYTPMSYTEALSFIWSPFVSTWWKSVQKFTLV